MATLISPVVSSPSAQFQKIMPGLFAVAQLHPHCSETNWKFVLHLHCSETNWKFVLHRGTEITEKKQWSPVFSAALCGISGILRLQPSPESVMIRYDQNFFYDPTQRHGDHREKTVPSVFSAALCGISGILGLQPSSESVMISIF